MMSIVYEIIKKVLNNSKELNNLSDEEKEKVYLEKYNQIIGSPCYSRKTT